MQIDKRSVIRLLEQIAVYMELKGENHFKIAAYRKAASALEADGRDISEIDNFLELPHIGKATASTIEEFLSTGKSSLLEQLKNEIPKGLIPLMQIQGLGAKKISKLYRELGIMDAESLRKACEEGKVETLKGFGKTTQSNILRALDALGAKTDRYPIGQMVPVLLMIEETLSQIRKVEKFSRAGSARRFEETLKGLDYVIATFDPKPVIEEILQMNEVVEAVAVRLSKVTVKLKGENGLQVTFRVVPPDQYAAALQYFTGSKQHNRRMRQIAKERGEKISEYGVERLDTGEFLTFSSEASLYHYFGLPYIPPEIRDDGSEIEMYKGTPFIQLDDLRGDLHMHTDWSDGKASLEKMVNACRRKGYEYIAITDHSKYLKVANGLSRERLLKQMEEIRRLNEKYPDILILSGIEMDILPDGTLDFDDGLLSRLDFVIASIHSGFGQSRTQIMKRFRRAFENPHIDMIAHPTGRLVGKRQGYDVDIDLLIQWAKETNTILELSGDPNRLDLSATNARKAQEAGVKIAINTDAHSIRELDNIAFGVGTARKGWIEPKNVVNTFSREQFIRFLNEKRR
ncbi:DNA polymerase/3'-5' exonuclease PolX [Weizmannia acidilactici]|uniref:DNA polymerase/3'-5' exonuclease PolX n=1 Tax=Weizmannia acidilactici TaxID=2607726 RepID=UPI00124BFBA9|nr:DNA polymerase/3'-5' exonuclease PolX [Weizmannia acidilactici]GER67047.1 DNA polymerase/3'-5' exonuclease PolX [Weizmannia acidilactici]